MWHKLKMIWHKIGTVLLCTRKYRNVKIGMSIIVCKGLKSDFLAFQSFLIYYLKTIHSLGNRN